VVEGRLGCLTHLFNGFSLRWLGTPRRPKHFGAVRTRYNSATDPGIQWNRRGFVPESAGAFFTAGGGVLARANPSGIARRSRGGCFDGAAQSFSLGSGQKIGRLLESAHGTRFGYDDLTGSRCLLDAWADAYRVFDLGSAANAD
jgi:hypothetical protein